MDGLYTFDYFRSGLVKLGKGVDRLNSGCVFSEVDDDFLVAQVVDDFSVKRDKYQKVLGTHAWGGLERLESEVREGIVDGSIGPEIGEVVLRC